MAIISNSVLEFRLNALIGAINRFSDRHDSRQAELLAVIKQGMTGGNSDLKPILERIEQQMATQEERLQAVGASLVKVQEGVDRIQASLEALKASNPALEDEISSIEAQVAALGADVAEATPEPAPEPTPEG